MSTTTLLSSVGQGSVNRPDDVGLVQTLLNRATSTKLLVDKSCGPKTLAAIVAFQKTFLANPDGRVDPNGVTWRKLSALHFALLPQQSGRGYFTYSELGRQYGTATTLKTILDVCRNVRFNDSRLVVGVGDISFEKGGSMLPHHTHQHGTNADFRPVRKDGKQGKTDGLTITDPQYDRERTALVIRSFLAHTNVRRILFNDTKIPGVHPYPGHDNHFHVEMKS